MSAALAPVLAPLQGVAGIVATQLGGPRPPGSERGEEFGKTSPIALVIILLLGVATALLIRSMSKRLRNLPESFDGGGRGGPGSGPRGPDDDGPGPSDGGGAPASRTPRPPGAGPVTRDG